MPGGNQRSMYPAPTMATDQDSELRLMVARNCKQDFGSSSQEETGYPCPPVTHTTSHGTHTDTLEQFGLTPDEVEDRLRFYRERFNIPIESANTHTPAGTPPNPSRRSHDD